MFHVLVIFVSLKGPLKCFSVYASLLALWWCPSIRACNTTDQETPLLRCNFKDKSERFLYPLSLANLDDVAGRVAMLA
uniref:Putative secreted protein n=1 Tax=Ixodes ricinus TaxID=34613 RepID=A0A147BEB4_IXORI